MFCPQCGTSQPNKARYCVACGDELPASPDQTKVAGRQRSSATPPQATTEGSPKVRELRKALQASVAAAQSLPDSGGASTPIEHEPSPATPSLATDKQSGHRFLKFSWLICSFLVMLSGFVIDGVSTVLYIYAPAATKQQVVLFDAIRWTSTHNGPVLVDGAFFGWLIVATLATFAVYEVAKLSRVSWRQTGRALGHALLVMTAPFVSWWSLRTIGAVDNNFSSILGWQLGLITKSQLQIDGWFLYWVVVLLLGIAQLARISRPDLVEQSSE